MKLNPNSYRRTLDALKPRILESEDRIKLIGDMAVYSHVPLLAIVLFCMRAEVMGPTQELTAFQDRLISFYGYTMIKPWID